MDELEALHARALAALVRGDTAGGIADLKAYLEGEPDDAGAWLEIGAAWSAIDHKPEARAALQKSVELDGSNVEARLAYARLLTRLRKIDDAAFQLLQASRIAPDDARVAKELGIAFYDKKLYDKSAAWLEKAAARVPDDARTRYALGLAHEGRRDMAAAVAAYRDAIRIDPSFTDARNTLADALASMGEHQQAIAELDQVLTLERSNERVAHNRAVLAHALDEMQRARLLGKTEKELLASALVERGGLTKKSSTAGEGGMSRVRFAAKLLEIDATLDTEGAILELLLVLPYPDRAAEEDDDLFRVTVLGEDGAAKRVDLATAASLTFLREALGCPMTQAAALYARLIAGDAEVFWGDAVASFASAPASGARHGLVARLRPSTA